MTKVKVTVENLNDEGGLFATPVWVAAHDGSFDTFSTGEAASAELEALAEDGNVAPLREAFDQSDAGVDGVIFGGAGVPGIIDPQEVASTILDVDALNNRYFSYASMVIPSNDAFVGNGDPLAFSLFDEEGNFNAPEEIIVGERVYDAGTEVNNEMEAAFINQTGPNTGDDENGVVTLHEGFIDSEGNPGGTPIILGGTNAAGFLVDPNVADFSVDGFEFLRFTFSEIEEINGTADADTIAGTAGDDSIVAGDGDDVVGANPGDDTVLGGAGDDTLKGNTGNDEVNGGAGNDRVEGNIGNDILLGGSGYDTLIGGSGYDSLNGGSNDDILFGNAGDDTLNGSSGDDSVKGGSGSDLVIGGSGEDTLQGNSGHDTLLGGGDNDELFAGGGNDELSGGFGDDTLYGQGNNDTLEGNSGDDSVNGGSGNDLVLGNAGNDTLSGDSGSDTLTGASGDDIFIHEDGDGITYITDFVQGDDLIQLDFAGVNSLEALLESADSVEATETTLTVVVDSSNTLIVEGDIGLTESDFVFGLDLA